MKYYYGAYQIYTKIIRKYKYMLLLQRCKILLKSGFIIFIYLIYNNLVLTKNCAL